MDSIRLLVADDHPMLREGLVAVLGTQPDFEVVGEAADGDEVVRLAGSLDPDVILLDLEMPGTDGVEALEKLRDAGSRARTIVFTAYNTDERILGSLRAGARGYLLKGADRGEIARALQGVAHGEVVFSAGIASRVLAFFAAGPGAAAALPATREVAGEVTAACGSAGLPSRKRRSVYGHRGRRAPHCTQPRKRAAP